jgi:hypothetical protein
MSRLIRLYVIIAFFAALSWGQCTGNCLATVGVTGGTSSSIDTSTATLIVIACANGSSACTTPTDSASNSYTALTTYVVSATNLTIYYKCGPTTSSTHTFTASAGNTIQAVAVKGTATASCFDSGQDVGTTTNCSTCTTSITPSAASAGYSVMSAFSNGSSIENPTFSSSPANMSKIGSQASSPFISLAWGNYNSLSAISISWSPVQAFGPTASAGFKGPSTAVNMPPVIF